MLDEEKNIIRLCDFGCSEYFKPANDKLSDKTKGTYLFMAPEIFTPTAEKSDSQVASEFKSSSCSPKNSSPDQKSS